ncbi:MAG: AAA family ATPase [Ignavibacteria bacterium]|nr:AAA family ATPase [Ignavibacteria bacterium]
MNSWLEGCETWLAHEYKNILAINLAGGPVRLRWLPPDSLTNEATRADANGLVIEDADIGWLLFLLPFDPDRLEQQVNQALGLRSQLLRESNYTGNPEAGDNEDRDSSWRVGLIWLVANDKWDYWQRQVLELRRESGAADEISFDALRVSQNNVREALDAQGLPRLLLHTRALLYKSERDAEKWLSADTEVSTELDGFSQHFDAPRTRAFARELEELKKSYQPGEARQLPSKARQFRRFRVNHFRNLESLEISADHAENSKAQAIVIFGPNGTGKSTFAEALSLAAFGTSPRLEQFRGDKDMARATSDTYLQNYVFPLAPLDSFSRKPIYAWDTGGKYEETQFTLDPDEGSRSRFEGVVLNQEDSLKFTELSREELAARVLRGYSGLADHLLTWLAKEEKHANETKLTFTRKHGLSGATKLSTTAYKGLAQKLLSDQLQRPSPEFLDWLRFLSRLSDEDGKHASKLVSDWTSQQDNVVNRLAETVAKLQEKSSSQSHITQAIRERLHEFDGLARRSNDFRQRTESRVVALREQLDVALTQVESWGLWLGLQADREMSSGEDAQVLKIEIDDLAKERAELERNGKLLRSRLDLLDQAKQFLTSHWAAQHPDTCPVCNSDVSKRQGIGVVVTTLQQETNVTIQTLRTRYLDIQVRQKDLDGRIRSAGLHTSPLAAEDQAHLRDWLQPFLPSGALLEDWLGDPQRRQQLKGDLSRMKNLPEAPKPYADATVEAERLANDFITLAQEADKALEDPQSIGEVKRAFEERMENVLKDHLPSTLEKVWLETALTLTTASWLLPVRPTLRLEQRGKSLSVQSGDESGRYVRYIYNAAERHVLGLAWFFTYYFAKRRFEEAWMLLDDPAQEMDQPSFRELVRLWETLLRLHQRQARPFTLIITLHQEERALDATRATNGRLYVLGWQKEQQDSITQPTVKKVVLLAPGFHPFKPEKVFS